MDVNHVIELNTLSSTAWLAEFPTHPAFQHIPQHYQHSIASYKEMSFLKAALHTTVYDQPRRVLEDYRILDTVPYYYIKFLLERNPQSILDLGCGLNIFKPYIPGIVGLDSNVYGATLADIVASFDLDYALANAESYDSIISINAIHFAPIDTITKRLTAVSQMMRPGYRSFVSFNIETWLMHTSLDTVQKLFGQIPKFDDVVGYVNDQILATNLNFCVVDWPVLHITEHSTIRDDLNGNIRLVFER